MKKVFLMFTICATVVLASCAGSNEESSQSGSASQTSGTVDAFPWDFPQEIALEAEVGQTVLAPYTFYPKALEDGESLDNTSLIFYSTTMEELGKTNSLLSSDKVPIPNALIIPMDKNGEAKEGDIVLTWWQKGSGLQRAIVTDASNPKQPKVNYLDLSWDRTSPDRPSMGEDHANEQLKEGSFVVIKDGEWVPGAQIVVREDGDWNIATLIHEKDDKVIVLGFASKVEAFKKSDCKLISFKENIAVGDNVKAKFVDGFNEGYTVTKVDKKAGLITCKDENGKEKIYTVGQVTKSL